MKEMTTGEGKKGRTQNEGEGADVINGNCAKVPWRIYE